MPQSHFAEIKAGSCWQSFPDRIIICNDDVRMSRILMDQRCDAFYVVKWAFWMRKGAPGRTGSLITKDHSLVPRLQYQKKQHHIYLPNTRPISHNVLQLFFYFILE